jgi:hypothetical protein
MQEQDLEGGARGLDAAFATADNTTLGGVESLASAANSQKVLYVVSRTWVSEFCLGSKFSKGPLCSDFI